MSDTDSIAAIEAVEKAAAKVETAATAKAAADRDVVKALSAVEKAYATREKIERGESLLDKAGRLIKRKAAASEGDTKKALIVADDAIIAADDVYEAAMAAAEKAQKTDEAAAGKLASAEAAAADAQANAAKQAELDDKDIEAGKMVRVRATATRAGDVVMIKDRVYVVDAVTADKYIRRNFAVKIEG